MTLWQNAKPWGSQKLGNGSSTIGGAGCVLTCLCEAARLFGTKPLLTPDEANEDLKDVDGAFLGSELVLAKAAPVYGLECPTGGWVQAEPGHQSLKDAFEQHLVDGVAAFVRVDIDGDGKGDHTILAVGRRDGAIDCLDPALAQHVYLSWPSLEVGVRWGKRDLTYRVVGFRPVRPAPV